MKNVKEFGITYMFIIDLHSISTSNSWVVDTICGTHIFLDIQGLKESRKLKHEELNVFLGNRRTVSFTMIGAYKIVLSNGVSLRLLICYYSPDMSQYIISFHELFKDGF